MTTVAVLVFPECVRSSVVGSLEVFDAANAYLAKRAADGAPGPAGADDRPGLTADAFDVRLVCAGGGMVHTPGIAIGPCEDLDGAAPDMIVIPAIGSDPLSFVGANVDLVDWVGRRVRAGTEAASICTGAFLLAATGVVDGRLCSTHWAAAHAFARTFPNVRLQPHEIITDEHGVYTSGGATSFYNLLLYVVEKHLGRDVSLWLAKRFLIDLDRSTQAPFIIFEPQKRHDDAEILEAQRIIERDYASDLSVGALSRRIGVSRRSLIRRFKLATRNTPIEYIQRVKIEAAKKALESGRSSVDEVMYGVGYHDARFFRSLFRKTTGLTPAAYRDRYRRRPVPSGVPHA